MAFFREETRLRAERLAVAAARRLVLRGRIATLDSAGRVVPDGFVCVEDDLIASVSAADAGIPPAFQGSPLIETGATIYPGLIELHNHPAYNAIPLWSVPTQYLNRGQWRNAPLYKRKMANPATLLTHHPQDISQIRRTVCRMPGIARRCYHNSGADDILAWKYSLLLSGLILWNSPRRELAHGDRPHQRLLLVCGISTDLRANYDPASQSPDYSLMRRHGSDYTGPLCQFD